ncbi:MAG: DNA methyltransferase [Chitinophagales bacterium]|nr:DNA methyltransferase [Chitinophagales bacterium]
MAKQCNIQYYTLTDDMLKEEKLQWFAQTQFKDIPFTHIQPDKNNNWINIADNDFDTLLPLADKAVKQGKSKKALFELFSLGVVTARDEWVYDFKEENIIDKVNFLIDVYNQGLEKHKGKDKDDIKNLVDYSIKWTRAVKNDLSKGKKYFYDDKLIIDSLYRPFIKKKLYFSKELNEMQYQLPILFSNKNYVISISGGSSSKPFSVLVTDTPYCYDLIEKTQCLPFYRYDANGNQIENITDWGFNQFTKQYGKKGITKESIFHYVYGVLHSPAYRKKYELNLKRAFPRIPLYSNFQQWSNWGKQLMELHLNYETIALYNLTEIITDTKEKPKAKLKADKENNLIILDENTTLQNIPTLAWQYKLGNRSALEWILDQYKEKKPKDPTIAEKFNNYKFADYKTQVIELLKRVCTVSVKTMKIIDEMENAE